MSTHPTVDALLTESATASDEFDDASAVLDDAGSLGPFLESLVTKSKEITMLDENLTTPVSSPKLYNYESRYPDDSYIDVNDEFIRQYMDCSASKDPDSLRKLLEKHAVKNYFTPDPEFATSPICILISLLIFHSYLMLNLILFVELRMIML